MRVLAARPAWTATRPRGCATPRNAPMTTARRCWPLAWARDRLSYVITPRFSPTSTPAQLAALGRALGRAPRLPDADPSERTDRRDRLGEIAFPEARDYLDTYEAHGLLGRNGLYGHASIWSRANATGWRGRCRADPLPDLEHLHRLGPFRHGRAWRAACASGWPPIPAAGRAFRCCAPWRRPTRSRSLRRHRAAPAQLSGWPPPPRPRRCGWATGSAASPRDSRRISRCSTSPRPRPSPSGAPGPRISGRRCSPRS
jgi:hypothetical protein